MQVQRELRRLIWNSTEGDGIVCPGSEFGLILAMNSALQWKWPNREQQGINPLIVKPLVFVSEDGSQRMEHVCKLLGKNKFLLQVNLCRISKKCFMPARVSG